MPDIRRSSRRPSRAPVRRFHDALVAALAETLRLSVDPRESRTLLRRAALDRDAVRALLVQARDWRRRDAQSATRIARAALLVARAGRAHDIAAEAAHVLG